MVDSFNHLNDIQINDDKAVLITTQIPKNKQPVTLNLEYKTINVKPIQLHDSTRILEV